MKTTTEHPPAVTQLAREYQQKLDALRAEDLKPFPEFLRKKEILWGFLNALAELEGSRLKPWTEYGNGEVLISAVYEGNSPHGSAACGPFGKPLADVLNMMGPRCGAPQYPRATMLPSSGWCHVPMMAIEGVIDQLANEHTN